MSIRRVKNRLFEEEEKLPPHIKNPVEKAMVTGYKAGGRAKRWFEDSKPHGKKWVERQKRKLGILKPKL